MGRQESISPRQAANGREMLHSTPFMRSDCPPGNRSPLRALAAVVCAALVVLGVFELHVDADHGADLIGPAGSFVAEAAHATQPRHAEGGRPVPRPSCAACLNALRAVGIGAKTAAIDPTTVPRPHQDTFAPPSVPASVLGTCYGRAPPFRR
jgi:hypothetical protein